MKRSRTESDVDARAVAEFGLTDLPIELQTHILSYLSPALCSTLTETCWALYHLYYASRRRAHYYLKFNEEPETLNDYIPSSLAVMRKKLQQTPAKQLRDVSLIFDGSYAPRYSLSLTALAPNVERLELGFPGYKTLQDFTFRDAAELRKVKHITLRGSAVDLLSKTQHMPILESITLDMPAKSLCEMDSSHRALMELVPETSVQRNRSVMYDARPLRICCKLRYFLRMCAPAHLAENYPNASIRVVVYVSNTITLRKFFAAMDRCLSTAHRITIKNQLADNVYDHLANSTWSDRNDLRTHRLDALAPTAIQAKGYLLMGIPELHLSAYSPLWLAEQIKGTMLSHRSEKHRTQTVYVQDAHRPHATPIRLVAGTDFFYLPPRRDQDPIYD